MRAKGRGRGRTIPALIACFYVGVAVGWLIRGAFVHDESTASAASAPVAVVSPSPAPASVSRPQLPAPVATSGRDVGRPVVGKNAAIDELRSHHLQLPIDDANVDAMKGGFAERRDNGGRGHEAVDILAPRNTAIHAVEDGTIAKLFTSKAGGTTIYQFDPSGRFCYYYAHLQRYAPGLHDGQPISKGEVIGYVGTSGNAPPNTPHLHFAIFVLNADRRWWQGTPIDPYLVFEK
jgi:murein DD-endopeptidase MepM/ murein hydrolase activator NlpD